MTHTDKQPQTVYVPLTKHKEFNGSGYLVYTRGGTLIDDCVIKHQNVYLFTPEELEARDEDLNYKIMKLENSRESLIALVKWHRKRYKELEAMKAEWETRAVSVNDKLPEDKDCNEDGYVLAFTELNGWQSKHRNSFGTFVTHWMPLPNPPKK